MTDFYGTLEGADSYHAERGNSAWAAASESDRAAALIRASVYIDSLGTKLPEVGKCVMAFPGRKTGGRAQTLQWPRLDAVDANGDTIEGIPQEVISAAYEAALLELTAGYLTPVYVASSGVKREKVDVLETEYFDTSGQGADSVQPVPLVVQALLATVMVRHCLGPAVFVV
jgi:hypothetical protein